MNKPFFSIIIPTYNRENLIKGTLQSLVDQSFGSFEAIIVDDGGKDNTKGVVESFSDERFKYFYKDNGERGAARNYGIDRANGRFITFIDSDDILYSNHFQLAAQQLQGKNEISCYAQAYEIKDALTGRVLVKPHVAKGERINNEIINGNFLSCFGVFVKKEILFQIRFEENRNFAGTEDWLLWLQLAARFPFFFNNTVTGAMLEHENRSVLSFNEDSLLYRTNFIKETLESDKCFVASFGLGQVQKIYAHMLSYASLHLALSNKKKQAIHYWWKSIKANSAELLTRRTLAISKKLLFS